MISVDSRDMIDRSALNDSSFEKDRWNNLIEFHIYSSNFKISLPDSSSKLTENELIDELNSWDLASDLDNEDIFY